MLRRWFVAAVLAACAAAPAFAQEEEEAIVVTGSRYRDRYEDFVVPHVAVVRRADAAAMALTVSSDTRDAAARRSDLNQALRSLVSRPGGAVTLGILDEGGDDDEGETRVRRFSVDLAMDLLRSGSRPDTSQITIATRTPIRADDTLDSVEQRLDGFRTSMPRPGRVEAWGGDLDLIVINPPQYRGEIIGAITTDAGRISTALGSAYGARLEGLENPIAWKRAGDLELRLFIPYRMIILPRDGTS